MACRAAPMTEQKQVSGAPGSSKSTKLSSSSRSQGSRESSSAARAKSRLMVSKEGACAPVSSFSKNRAGSEAAGFGRGDFGFRLGLAIRVHLTLQPFSNLLREMHTVND